MGTFRKITDQEKSVVASNGNGRFVKVTPTPQTIKPALTYQTKAAVTAPTIDRRASAAKRAEKQATGTIAQFIRDYNSDSSKPFLIGRDISGKTSIRSKVDYESMIADLKKQQTAAIYEAERAVTTAQKSSAENLAVKLAGEMQQLREKQSSEANEYYRLENELQRYSLSKNQEAEKTYDSARTLQKDLEALDRAIMLYNNADPMDTEDPFVVAEDVMEKYGITAQDFANASMHGDLKLSNIRKQIAKELETASAGLEQKGYQFARMSQYQDTMEKAKQYQQESEARQQWAKEHPIAASVSSVLRSPLQGVEFLELAAENIGNDPKDLQDYVAPNVYDMVNTNAVNQVRGTVSKEIEENTDWELFGQNVASFLYQTGMSTVDSAAQVAAFGPAATVFMGGAAASSTASDIIQRGGTSSQAFWGGLAAGAAEAVFEKLSVDNLLKAKDVTSVKTLIREAVKQSGVEASEEMLTEIANIISDSMIMGEKGNYAQAVAAYEAQGMSREDAQKKAVLDSIGQVLWAGAGGAISGGLTGGAYRAAGLMQYRASDYGQAESTVNAVNATLKKAGVEDPTAFYESVGVENPYLEAMTPEGKEFLSGAAEAYANLKKSAAQYAQTRQQQPAQTEPETMEAPRGNVLDRAVAEVRESGTLSNRTATEILNTPEAVQTLEDSGLTLTSGMTQSQRRAAVKTAVERAALPDTIKNAMVDVGLSWEGNRPITEETQPAPEVEKNIAYDNAELYDGVIWNGNRHLFEQQARQEAEQASAITEQAAQITEQQQRETAMAAESQAVVNEQQEGSNNAIPGLYWAGSQTQPEIAQTGTVGYTGTEPGTAQTVQSERMTANETRTDVSGGVAGRELSERAGEQAGIRVQSDTGRIGPATEQSRAAASRQALGKNLGTEKVSSKSLGLENGTDNATVQVIPESQWDEALQETARWVRDETYKDVVFVLGPMEVEKGGKVSRIRGVYLEDKIIVQADHTSLTPEQIARHEEWHDITRRTPVAMRDVRQKIEDNYSVEELENIIQAYVKRMRHLLDLPENPTNEQLHEALLKAEEEVYADAYAGINAFGTNASQYQETVQDFANREKQQRQEQRQQEAQQETGPPAEPVERYSMEDEELDLDKLYEQEERARQDRIQQINKRLEKLTALDYQEQRFRESGVEALAADDREVRKLRKELSKLEGVAEVENKKTGEKKAVPVQPILAKMEFRDNMLNLFSIPQSQRGEIGAVLENFADHVAKSGKIDERARSALFDRLYEEGVMQVAADEYLAMGREAVAGGRVYVPQEVKDEFGDDWNDFRRRLFANKIYAVDDQAAAGIDTWSAELAEVLPGLFEADVYDRKQALERILQVAEEGADQNLSLAEYTAQVAGETGVDVDTILMDMERQMDYQIQKFASMANLETELRARPELLRAEANERVQAIREQRDRTVQKVIDHYNDILQRRTAEMEQAVGEARATAAQRVQKVREQRDRTVEKVQAHYNEMRERNVAQRERAIQEAREAASERVQRAREQRDRTVDRVREAAAERVQKTREQRDRAVDKVRESARQQVQRTRDQRDRIVERMKTHYTNIIYKQREQVEANNAKERARRKEMMERRKERIHLQSLQQETLKQLQWLSKNRNKAPEDLKAAFDEVLSDIDIYAIGVANELNFSKKYNATWGDIAEMYWRITDKDSPDYDPNFLPSEDLKKIMARINGAKIGNMSIDTLQDLYKAAVGLRTELQNRNRVIADEKQRLFSEVYEDVEQEFKEAAGKYKGTKRDHLINRDQLNPMNYLQRMAGWNPDSTWYSMAKQLEAGEREVRRYKVNAILRLQEFLKEHKDWVAKADGQGKDAIWYELEVSQLTELNMGSKPVYDTEHPVTIYMTPSQKVHLYLESKNTDNLRHMLGGRTFVNKELYAKGKRKEALAQGTIVRLAPEDVKRIVSDMTDTELQLAKLLEDYYNQFAKQEINRVSNLLYGYDKAIGQNYAPIYTNQNYTQKEIGTYDATAEGVGNLKQRKVSKNPSYNISAFDAFERHVDQTAKFVGLSVPIRNWNTMLNWGTFNNSMGDIITHKWGQEAQNYITDIIKRLQNSQFDPKDVASELGDKLQSQYTRAVFGFNWGTVAKQLGGLSVAAADLGRKNIPSPAHVKRVKNELINIYTPELAYRGMGYSTMETKHLKEHPGWTERKPFLKFTIGGGAITAMDQQVVKSMWAWAENKVQKEYPTLEVGDKQQVQNGDSPFYKKVAEVFEQALYNTQPMADEMHVSALRKSKNVVARSVTMFRSDAMAAYNLMRKRMGEAAYYEKTGQKQKAKEAKRAVGTAAMYIAGNSLFAVLVNFVNNIIKYKGEKYKDEEEKRMTAWSVGSEMVLDMVQSMAGSAMAGGDVIAELIGTAISKKKWYGLDAPGVEQISELLESGWNTIRGTYKIITDLASIAETENATVAEYWNRHWQEFAGAITGAAEQATTLGFGLPASNLSAYIMGLISWLPFVGPKAKAELEGLTEITKKSSLADAEGTVLEVKVRQLLEHRLGGDQSMAAEEIARLYESGVPSASSAVFGDTPKEINDEKLTEGQQQVYDMAYRDLVNDALDDLMDSDSYIAADDETRCKMLKSLYDYADDMAREAVVPGSVKLTTEAGNLTEFGKADYLLESGLSLAEYIQLKSADAVDDAVDAVEAGEPVQQSMEVALLVSQAMDKLPKDATDLQKQEAAFDAVKPGQEEMTAAVMVIDKDDMPKLELAYAYGVTPGMVTDFKARFDKVYGEDMNGKKITVNQERAEDIISEMIGYSSEERAILWQMQNKSWKWQKNPYNRQIAREFVEEAGWNEEK